MKKTFILRASAIGIILLFAVFGFGSFILLSHEYIHYFDFRGEVKSDTDQICLFTVNTGNFSWNEPIAMYSYDYLGNETEYEKKSNLTEVKAYGFNFFTALIFLFICRYTIKYAVEINVDEPPVIKKSYLPNSFLN